jgi:hypothetical protein
MPAYEINYLDHFGILACKFSAQCADDREAKIMAHAMKHPDHHGLEVWDGKELIYRRPEMPQPASPHAS